MRRLVTAALSSIGRTAGRVWSAWREFWFTPADPTPLAVMRILFGGMLLYTHIVWGMNLEGFFGPSGWQSETLVRTFQQGQFAWSFWWWVPGNLHLAVHVVCLGVLALYMLGVLHAGDVDPGLSDHGLVFVSGSARQLRTRPDECDCRALFGDRTQRRRPLCRPPLATLATRKGG